MNYKSEMIHRRVPLINSLELQLEEERRQLRVIRRINDKVDIPVSYTHLTLPTNREV